MDHGHLLHNVSQFNVIRKPKDMRHHDTHHSETDAQNKTDKEVMENMRMCVSVYCP